MKINTERQMVHKEVDTLSLDYVSLGDAVQMIESLINAYGGDAQILKTSDRYDPTYDYFGVFVDVPETDSQMADRIQRETEHAAYREDFERKEFARLQKKFSES